METTTTTKSTLVVNIKLIIWSIKWDPKSTISLLVKLAITYIMVSFFAYQRG